MLRTCAPPLFLSAVRLNIVKSFLVLFFKKEHPSFLCCLCRQRPYSWAMPGTLPELFAAWFASRGWAVRPHQLAVLDAAASGENVLLIAPTGGGKTLAGFLPSLVALAEAPGDKLHTLYVSPLKALATDIARNLTAPVTEMRLPIRIETRTGDTPANRRARQKVEPPQLLLTTPES